jgi:hypothetical protein
MNRIAVLKNTHSKSLSSEILLFVFEAKVSNC